MSAWFRSTPRFGPAATVSHHFGRSARVPTCVADESLDTGGLVSLVADELAPRCDGCTAALRDDGERMATGGTP